MNFKSFRYKLFLYTSIIVGILLCSLSFFAFAYVNNSIVEDTMNSNQELTHSISANVDSLFDEINKLSLYASTNPSVREAMTSLYYSETASIYFSEYNNTILEVLTSISVPNSASSYRITILNEKNFFETTGIPTLSSYTSTFLFSEEYVEWYEAIPIINHNESIVFETYDPWTNSEEEYVTIYRQIFTSSSTNITVGIAMVQCPVEDFLDLITFDDDTIESYIFDEDGTLLMSSTTLEEDSFVSLLSSDELAAILLSTDTTFNYNSTYTVDTLSNGWQLLVVQTQNMFTAILFPIILYLICGTLLLILITIFLIYLIMNRTTRPLQQLIKQVNEVSLSNLSINTQETSFDEFEVLNDAFSDMFSRLRSSMDENEKRKTYELQANLIALQSQMDPHFLYNILSVIKSMNREKNHTQVDYCCNYLAKMLRYLSTYDESSVTLSRELEHAELYLNLMKFRYEDQFNFYINVDSSIHTENIYINKLIIQPLLENCFQHGFKNVLPVWNIIINCYILENYWYISISDNGGGMTNEQIEKIFATVDAFTANPSDSISQLTLGGMGLVNTLSRLRLNRKDDVSFTIAHNYPKGTIITIKGVLPDEYICD